MVVALALSMFVRGVAADENDNSLPKPPEEFSKLFDSGIAKLSFYTRRPSQQQYEGETRFNFSVKYRFQFRSRISRSQTGLIARGSITYSNVSIDQDLVISLPYYYQNKGIWDAQLVRHELEHVRISADPRITLLLRRLITSVNRFEIPLSSTRNVSREQVREYVDKRIKRHVAEVTRIVQSNNDLLDRITAHGRIWAERDPNFFLRLYTEGNLKDADFQSIEDLGTLLKSRRYRVYSESDDIKESSADAKNEKTEQAKQPL